MNGGVGFLFFYIKICWVKEICGSLFSMMRLKKVSKKLHTTHRKPSTGLTKSVPFCLSSVTSILKLSPAQKCVKLLFHRIFELEGHLKGRGKYGRIFIIIPQDSHLSLIFFHQMSIYIHKSMPLYPGHHIFFQDIRTIR